MTTIEQSPVVQDISRNAKQGIARDDGKGSGREESQAKSFDDLVSDAEQKLGRSLDDGAWTKDDADPSQLDTGDASDVENLQAAATTGADKRVRISTSFQQLLRSAGTGQAAISIEQLPQAEKNAAPADRKLDLKNKVAAEPEAKVATSASEQLSMLLGLTSTEEQGGEAPAETKAASRNRQGAEAAGTTDAANASQPADMNAVSMAIDVLNSAASQLQAVSETTTHREGKDRAAGADEEKAERDEIDVVRLVSKDGKGAPVDIALTDDTSQAKSDAPAQSGGKTDFVTVLDSRRYLGFTNDSNAATLTNAIKADPSWSQALNAVTSAQNAIEGNTATTVNTLKLQMNPENLGNMTASLRLKGEELTVEVKVETVEAFRHLSNDHDQIVKALKDQGFTIDQVTIQLSAPEKTSSGQDGGNQSQNGQDTRDGLGQNARQREENERRTANHGTWQDNDQTSSQSDNATAPRNGAVVDSGDLYL